MSKEDGLKHRKPFKKNDPRINTKGRPLKLYSHINKELRQAGYEPVSPSQLKDNYELLLNLPISQILLIAGKKVILNEKEIQADNKAAVILGKEADEYPYSIRLVARAILAGKGFEILEKLIDRAHGKAINQTDLTTKGEKLELMPPQINIITDDKQRE